MNTADDAADPAAAPYGPTGSTPPPAGSPQASPGGGAPDEAAAGLKKVGEELAQREDRHSYLALILENITDAVYAIDPQVRVTAWNRAAEEMFGVPASEAIGRPLAELVGGEFLEPSQEEVQRIMAETGRYRGLIRYDRRDGTSIVSETTGMWIRDAAGNLATGIGVNRDVTAQRQAQVEREAALEAMRDQEARLLHQAERLQMVHDIDRGILAAQSVPDIAQTAAERIRVLVPCERVSVILFDRERGEGERVAMASVLPTRHVRGQRLPLAAFPMAMTSAAAQGLVLPDLGSGPVTPLQQALAAEGLRSYLGLPLVVKGTVIGFLSLMAACPGAFTDEHVEVGRQVADSLAVAIQNTQLLAEAEQERRRHQSLAYRLVEIQENERRAIARELHDEAGQALTSLMVGLGLIERETHEPPIAERAKELKQTVDGVLEGLHRLARALRPASLDRVGLAAALQQHVEAFRQQTGLDVELAAFNLAGCGDESSSTEPGGRLPQEVETALYRIVQEGLTNVARHARAHHVGILVERRGDRAVAIVEDDGVGFDLEEALARGRLGVFGMRERAEMLGGALSVESAPGAGTTVFVEIPCGGWTHET